MLMRTGLMGSSLALSGALLLAFACTSTTGSDDSDSMGGDDGGGAKSPGKAGSSSESGSSSGGTGMGGTKAGGGTGGTEPTTPNCEGAAVADGSCGTIDDLEDGDDKLLVVEGRAGTWYAFDDGSGTASPARDAFETAAAEDRPASAIHSTGEGFSDYGGGVGFGISGCYDAAAYDGISFWAKGDPEVLGTIRFSVATSDTRAEDQGGTCKGTGCGDNFGIPIELTTEWKQYEIMWKDLYQVGWGQAFPLNTHNLKGIDFTAYSDDKPFGWDFWIDDIAFLGGKHDGECTPEGGGNGGAGNGTGGDTGAGGGG